MEGSLFAVNYWAVIGGLGLARITPGLTLQAEVTVFQLTRVRGPETQDKSRTNLTAGLHAGHFFSPKVSFGAELRGQRWLTDAAPVGTTPDARQQVTLGLGTTLPLQARREALAPARVLVHARVRRPHDAQRVRHPAGSRRSLRLLTSRRS